MRVISGKLLAFAFFTILSISSRAWAGECGKSPCIDNCGHCKLPRIAGRCEIKRETVCINSGNPFGWCRPADLVVKHEWVQMKNGDCRYVITTKKAKRDR